MTTRAAHARGSSQARESVAWWFMRITMTRSTQFLTASLAVVLWVSVLYLMAVLAHWYGWPLITLCFWVFLPFPIASYCATSWQRLNELPPGHCPICRYDLAGLADGVACPECGNTAKGAAGNAIGGAS